MANDRIFMKCHGCGETKMMAKYYPTIGRGVWFPESVSEWVEQHMWSCVETKMDLEGDRCFDLFTESDERFNELYSPHKE